MHLSLVRGPLSLMRLSRKALFCFALAGGLSLAATPARAFRGYATPGLTGDYYYGYWGGSADFFTANKAEFSRTDGEISFSDALYDALHPPLTSWGFAGTALAGEELFSVEWNGSLLIDTPGTYYFQTLSDDSIQLLVNHIAVITNLAPHPPSVDEGPLALAAGVYPLTVYFGEGGGQSVAQLSWKPPGVSSYTTITTVPAPLPVLGLGVILPFRRQLRRLSLLASAPRRQAKRGQPRPVERL